MLGTNWTKKNNALLKRERDLEEGGVVRKADCL